MYPLTSFASARAGSSRGISAATAVTSPIRNADVPRSQSTRRRTRRRSLRIRRPFGFACCVRRNGTTADRSPLAERRAAARRVGATTSARSRRVPEANERSQRTGRGSKEGALRAVVIRPRVVVATAAVALATLALLLTIGPPLVRRSSALRDLRAHQDLAGWRVDSTVTLDRDRDL